VNQENIPFKEEKKSYFYSHKVITNGLGLAGAANGMTVDGCRHGLGRSR